MFRSTQQRNHDHFTVLLRFQEVGPRPNTFSARFRMNMLLMICPRHKTGIVSGRLRTKALSIPNLIISPGDKRCKTNA